MKASWRIRRQEDGTYLVYRVTERDGRAWRDLSTQEGYGTVAEARAAVAKREKEGAT